MDIEDLFGFDADFSMRNRETDNKDSALKNLPTSRQQLSNAEIKGRPPPFRSPGNMSDLPRRTYKKPRHGKDGEEILRGYDESFSIRGNDRDGMDSFSMRGNDSFA